MESYILTNCLTTVQWNTKRCYRLNSYCLFCTTRHEICKMSKLLEVNLLSLVSYCLMTVKWNQKNVLGFNCIAFFAPQ